jgi:hypothetical protein
MIGKSRPFNKSLPSAASRTRRNEPAGATVNREARPPGKRKFGGGPGFGYNVPRIDSA